MGGAGLDLRLALGRLGLQVERGEVGEQPANLFGPIAAKGRAVQWFWQRSAHRRGFGCSTASSTGAPVAAAMDSATPSGPGTAWPSSITTIRSGSVNNPAGAG